MEPDSPCFLTLITKPQSHFGVPILQNYVFVSAIKSHNPGHLNKYKLVSLSVQFATNLADAISDLRLACSAGVFWVGQTLFTVFVLLEPPYLILRQRKIGESRNIRRQKYSRASRKRLR